MSTARLLVACDDTVGFGQHKVPREQLDSTLSKAAGLQEIDGGLHQSMTVILNMFGRTMGSVTSSEGSNQPSMLPISQVSTLCTMCMWQS